MIDGRCGKCIWSRQAENPCMICDDESDMYEVVEMYEVYLRNWNSGVNIATIYKADSLKECEKFAEKWNKVTSELYEGKCIDDMYRFFADVYDIENCRYVHGL